MPPRLTIEEMHQIAKSKNGKFLSEEYKGSNIKHLWECSEGHQWEAPPYSIKRGCWCPICSKNREKLTIEEMHQLAESRGGKFISSEYKGANIKHSWECSKGHQWETTPGHIKNGTWCPICRIKKESS